VEGAVVATFDLSTQGYDRDRGLAFFARAEEELRALPGVSAAGLARQVPVRAGGMLTTVAPEGYPAAPDETLRAELNVVSPGFFAALGVPLRGRAFTTADAAGAPPVAIVNRAFADRYWPGQEAVGRRIGALGFGPADADAEVVGVAVDYQTQSVREAQGPVVFLPLAQRYLSGATLVVRGRGGEEILLPRVRQAMARLEPQLPLYDAGSLASRLRRSLGEERALAVMLTALGSVALLLALLGLGSSLAFATEMRTREMGVRLAVGARGRQVAWLVVQQALAIAAGGCALGVLLAFWVTRTLEGLLFGVEAHDPVTLVSVTVLLLASSVVAAWLPARRAARLDPVLILREG
jgi:predicted permease